MSNTKMESDFPAEAADAVVVLADDRAEIHSIHFSLSADAESSVVVDVDGSVEYKVFVTKGGPGPLRFDAWRPANTGQGTITVTLAGVLGTTGTLNVETG